METQTGQRTNAEYVPLLTALMDLSLVKDDVVWTDTVSNPARGDRLLLRAGDDLISNISLQSESSRRASWRFHIYFFFFPLLRAALSFMSHVNILQQLPQVL